MGAAGLRERAKEFLDFYTSNLEAHFRAEEEVLFPALHSAIPATGSVIEELIREHVEIRQIMPRLAAGSGLAKLIFDLGDLLERHIRREERELFPLFEQHIQGSQAEMIGEELKKIVAAVAPR